MNGQGHRFSIPACLGSVLSGAKKYAYTAFTTTMETRARPECPQNPRVLALKPTVFASSTRLFVSHIRRAIFFGANLFWCSLDGLSGGARSRGSLPKSVEGAFVWVGIADVADRCPGSGLRERSMTKELQRPATSSSQQLRVNTLQRKEVLIMVSRCGWHISSGRKFS